MSTTTESILPCAAVADTAETAAGTVLQWPQSLYRKFHRKPGAGQESTHYCPGCGHGVLHKLIAEAMDDLGIRERTVFISPVGCSVFGYYYFDCGNVQVAHGRAPAVATGIKRALPHSIVISYQGDGDLAAIGTSNILHAANRGESITVFFVNNAIYGMTGGQMAPTTLDGQRTSTTPRGRDTMETGSPLRVSELLSTLSAPVYIERVALTDGQHIMSARRAVRKALQAQVDGKGFSLVEVLSPCPVGWKLEPAQAKEWLTEHLIPNFPLGVFKDEIATRAPRTRPAPQLAVEQVKELFAAEPAVERTGAPTWDGVAERYREPQVKIAGFGGQGVLFLGALLANVALRRNYHVTWLPAYGPESRGGTANCNVVISEEPVAAPMVTDPTVLMALNGPSLERFEETVVPGGVIVYNSTLIANAPTRTDVEVLAVPATAIADELGEARSANLVMLGAYLAHTGMFSQAEIDATMEATLKRAAMVELNRQAIARGFAAAG
jgi:2-oxoisovalerate ferredoxin oxidoreductase beta subunit